jgi:N-acyl homoserine lactone hydrolase
VLLCGYEVVPPGLCLRGGGDGFVMSVPISAYLLETRGGRVVFDTGFDSSLPREPEQHEKHFEACGLETLVVWPQHEMLQQLAQIGAASADIRHVILNHAHFDRTGKLKHFPNATVWMQAAERDYAFADPPHPGVLRQDFESSDIDWCWVDDDHEIMPRLKLVATQGHTPGHQSALVTLPETGPVVLVGDVGDWLQNFDEEILPGEATDDEKTLASIRRINALRRDLNATLFVCHDPRLIRQQKLAPDYYA